MPDENILKFIKDGLAQGRTEDIVRRLLHANGWAQKAIDEAFAFIEGKPIPDASAAAAGGAFGTNTNTDTGTAPSKPQPSPQQRPQQPQRPLQPQQQSQQSPPPRLFRYSFRGKGLWIIAGILVFAVVLSGGWLAYAYFATPSPQQVLDAMFKTGFAGMMSADNDTAVSLVVQLTPASSTPGTPDPAPSAATTMSPYAATLLSGISSGGPSSFSLQAESSGTFVIDPNGNRDLDQNMQMNVKAGQSGQSVTFSGGGELRVVNGVVYLNLATIPNFGIFNFASLQGKWIMLQADSSTLGFAQSFTGQPSLAVPSGTLSAADIQKMTGAMEQAITITKTLPDAMLDGVANYHYQYTINKQGLQNAALTIAAIAAHSLQGASSTLDASTTAAITTATENFLGAFTTMGGEIWIGKSDHYPHQISLLLAFSTSTPNGDVSGALTMTSTLNNINGGQTVSAPSGAEDLQTLLQPMFVSSTTTAAPAPSSATTGRANSKK